MSPVIVQATRQALGEVGRLRAGAGRRRRATAPTAALPMSVVLLGIAATGLAIFALLPLLGAGRRAARHDARAGVDRRSTLVIAFLFAAVSAWAIAMISITPISGMTLTTLIVTAVVLSALGLRGESGMLQVLLIGGVVCTALSMSGSLVTQYKIGYWLGATPRRIEIRNLSAPSLASAATTAVILLMAKVYGFAPGPATRTRCRRRSPTRWRPCCAA